MQKQSSIQNYLTQSSSSSQLKSHFQTKSASSEAKQQDGLVKEDSQRIRAFQFQINSKIKKKSIK